MKSKNNPRIAFSSGWLAVRRILGVAVAAVAVTMGGQASAVSTNIAVASATTTNGVPLPPQTSQVPFSAVSAQVQIFKSVVSPAGHPAAVGEQIIFAIRVTNSGTVALDTVPLTDTYNTNLLSILSWTPSANSTNLSVGSLSWTNIGPLAAGGSVTVTARFTSILSGTGTNVALTAPTTTNGVPVNPVTSSVPHTAFAPSIAISKTVTSPAGRPASIGETVVFTVLATNTGNIMLDTVPLVDFYNTNLLSILSQTAPANSTNLAAGSLSWTNIGPLAIGGTVSVTVRFTAITNGIGTNVVVTIPTTTNGIPVPPKTNEVPHTNVNPRLNFAKVFLGFSEPNVLGQFSANYRLSVVNTNLSSVPYTLTDTPQFDTNITVTGAAVTGQAVTNFAGAGPYVIASNVLIVSGSTHTYTVQVAAVLSAAVLNGTANLSQCGVGPGSALFNAATVVNGANNDVTTTNACGNVPPVLQQTKTGLAVSSPDGLGNFTATYRVTEHNSGGDGIYSLTDTTKFDTNVTVTGAAISGQLVTNYAGIGPYTLASNAVILAGATHTYTVTVSAVLSAAILNGTTNITACGGGSGTPGSGLYNEAVVRYGTNTVVTNSTCLPLPPVLQQTKTFLAATETSALGNFTATYRVTEHNSGGDGIYSLTDTTKFDTNVTVTGAAISGQLVTNYAGIGPYTLASNAVILAGATHTYTVTVSAVLSAAILNGTTNITACGGGSGTPGAGLYNEAVVRYGTNTVVTNSTCGEVPPIPRYKLDKTLFSPTNRPAAVGEQIVFIVTVTNSGEVGIGLVPLTDTYSTSLLSYVSSTPSADSVSPGSLTWTNIGPIGIGQAASVTVVFNAIATGQGTNSASASPITTNNTPLLTTTARAPHQAFQTGHTLTKTLDSPNVRAAYIGQSVVFSISVINTGNIPLGVVGLVDTFDSTKLSYSNAIPPPNMVGSGTLTWTNVGPIAVGGSTNITVTFKAIATTQPGLTTNFAITTVSYTNGIPGQIQTSSAPVEIAANATIGDFVWLDNNPNGVQEIAEPGIPNIQVRLYDASTNLLKVTNTTATGFYTFDVNAGSYILQFSPPPGFGFVTANVTTNDFVDSDADYISGRTAIFAVQPGQLATNYDAGMYRASTYNLIADVLGEVRGSTPVLSWQTTREAGEAYFEVSRRDLPQGAWAVIHTDLLPAIGSALHGALYSHPDIQAQPGSSHEYQITSIDVRGSRTVRGPYAIRYPSTSTGLLSAAPVQFTAAENSESNGGLQRYQEAELLSNEPQLMAGQIITAIKVAVMSDGLYSLNSASLAAAFNTTEAEITERLAGRTLGIEHLGRPVAAIYASNALSFYARGLHTMYTDQNVYWVKQGGGIETASEATTLAAAVTGQTFTSAVTVETNITLLVEQFTNPASDPWVGPGLLWSSSFQKSYQTVCSLPGVVSGNHIVVRLMGRSISANNAIVVTVNGAVVATNVVSGMNYHVFTNSLAGVPLYVSSNVVKISALSGTPDYVYVDSYTINYERNYLGTGVELLFADDGHETVTVFGFSNADIEVYDVSVPDKAVSVIGLNIEASGGGYGASFHPTTAHGRYLAVAGGFRRMPISVTPDIPSNLHDQQNGADYLAITFTGLGSSVQQLVNYRSTHGLSAVLVEVQDIYDEFNFGITDPRAIRSFLGYAYRMWERSPRYVVFVGEGSLDYRNYKGFGDCKIPPMIAGNHFGLQASDQLFGDVDGDGTAEISVGRIPALTPGEFAHAFSKIQAYEQGGSWKANAISLADVPDAAGQFEVDSDYLATQSPDHIFDRNHIRTQSLASAHSSLMSSLGAGRGLFTYFGHADGHQLTSSTNIFVKSDVARLGNASKPTLMLALTCLVGDYGQTGNDSLSETMVVSADGAAAVWAAGKQQYNADGRAMGASLASDLFTYGTARVGDAIISSTLANAANVGACQAYNLLGDPALAVGDMNAARPGALTPADRPTYAEWVAWAIAPAAQDAGTPTETSDDADGDGVANGDEYVAGTDPLDSDSILVFIDTAQSANGQILVQWKSSAHRLYQLERMTDLVSGSYSIIGTDIPATPPKNMFTDTVNNASTLIYRVRVK